VAGVLVVPGGLVPRVRVVAGVRVRRVCGGLLVFVPVLVLVVHRRPPAHQDALLSAAVRQHVL
jgi:hypothetical protein